MAFAQFRASLIIEDDTELTEQMVVVALGRRLSETLSIHTSVGMILGGDLSHSTLGDHDVGRGFIASLQGGMRILTQHGARPFVSGSLSLSASRTSTTPVMGGETSSLFATDIRVSAVAGYQLRDIVSMHGAARAFVGPISWSNVDESGRDKKFVQLAVGGAIVLPKKTRLFAEWAFFGERNISVGAGLSF